MNAVSTILIYGAAMVVITACSLLPQKLTLGTGTDQRFRQSSYSASLSWDLQPKRIREEYIVTYGGYFGGDAP